MKLLPVRVMVLPGYPDAGCTWDMVGEVTIVSIEPDGVDIVAPPPPAGLVIIMVMGLVVKAVAAPTTMVTVVEETMLQEDAAAEAMLAVHVYPLMKSCPVRVMVLLR